MTIRAHCAACGVKLRAEDRHSGKTIPCPACQQPLTIPLADARPAEILDPFAEEAQAHLSPPPSVPVATPQRRSKSKTSVLPDPKPLPPAVEKNVSPSREAAPDFMPEEETYETGNPDSEFPDLSDEDLQGEVISPLRKKRPPVTDDEERPAKAASRKARPTFSTPPSNWRMHLHWGLILALIPLVLSMIFRTENDVLERLTQSVENHPEISPDVVNDSTSLHDVAMLFPDHRIDGAWLAADTYWHWGLAAASCGVFLSLFLAMWPDRETRATLLILAGVATGTVGILLLLGFQWVAFSTQGVMVRGRGIGTLLFYIVKFIGFSYRSALDPDVGFFSSFFGFTFGVGLCEELCKAIPVVVYLQGSGPKSLRHACLVGLASGVGFGISEGITYSSEYYNGIQNASIYLIRFLSCVSLHALWAGSVAILIYQNQEHLEFSWEGVFSFFVYYLLVAMLLHGAYDTLLKQERELLAVASALVSFFWFQWLLARAPAEV